MMKIALPPPDGSSAEADTLVWVCVDCSEAKTYSKGDILRRTPKCSRGHEMKLLERTDVA